MNYVNLAALAVTLIASTGFAQYGQYEFDVASGGGAHCFRQKDNRSVGTAVNPDLCIKYGLKNRFEFDVSTRNYIHCFLQRDERSVASAGSDLCWRFGLYNDFLFDVASDGRSACFLQRNGKSVGYAVLNSWCSR